MDNLKLINAQPANTKYAYKHLTEDGHEQPTQAGSTWSVYAWSV
jgi:hypothetical protein